MSDPAPASPDDPPPGDLSLAEWVVLAVVDEGPTHGFAIAALTARDGDLGRVWHVAAPVVYRAIGRLDALGLIARDAVESGRGPRRTRFAATPTGRDLVAGWLERPVGHVRDVRSALLLKLALLHRRGGDLRRLARAQRDALAPIRDAMATPAGAPTGTPAPGGDFEAVLAAWRRANVEATVAFLDELAR